MTLSSTLSPQDNKRKQIEIFAKTALELKINRFLLLKSKQGLTIKYDISRPIDKSQSYEEIVIVEVIPSFKNGSVNYSINAWNYPLN